MSEQGRADGVAEPFDLIIEAGRSERHCWLDLWRYRELFNVLTWFDIVVCYKVDAGKSI